MRNKIITVITTICLIICSTTIITGCKIFDKVGACQHTYTTFGICNLCTKDISINLTMGEDNIYTTPSHSVISNRDYYYKLTGNGENGIELSILSSDEIKVFNYVKLFSSQDEDDYVTLQSNYTPDGTIYTYDGTLTQDHQYYIEISYTKSQASANSLLGDITVQVTPTE